MKIFFITSKLNFVKAGGSIEEFDVMIRNLIGLGNDVTVVTFFSHSNDIPEQLPYRVIEEWSVSRRLWGIQRDIFRVLRKYERQADFFHVDGHLFLYGAGLYRRLGGRVPVSAFFNRELEVFPENISTLFPQKRPSLLYRFKRSVRRAIERHAGMPLANGMDIVMFTNPLLRQAYENLGLRKDPRALIIGDPLDYKAIMSRNDVREGSYLSRAKKTGPVVLFYSSRMAPGKGFDLLVAAFAELKDKDRFRLILGGTGPEEQLIRTMVSDLGLKKYVAFPGWVSKEDLYGYYKQADIFVQAHWRTDNTSISLSYAMAFGVPSVVPGGGGLEWLAKDAALYFEDGNYHDLARKIELLGGDPALRESLSRNCYRRIAEDEMNCKTQVGRIYREMQRVIARRA